MPIFTQRSINKAIYEQLEDFHYLYCCSMSRARVKCSSGCKALCKRLSCDGWKRMWWKWKRRCVLIVTWPLLWFHGWLKQPSEFGIRATVLLVCHSSLPLGKPRSVTNLITHKRTSRQSISLNASLLSHRSYKK